jgi:uncharacterized protein YgiM (DUF1202 family)
MRIKAHLFLPITLVFLFLHTILALAAETGSAIKDDQLRAEPFTDAKTVASVKRGESLTILKKQGVWLQVKNAKSTGWLKLLSVKRASTTASSANTHVLSQNSGRSGTGQIVSTTGIRGLNEEELKAATFNEAEVNKLESYTVSDKDGAAFAKAGQLSAIQLAEITAPEANSTNSAVMGGAK